MAGRHDPEADPRILRGRAATDDGRAATADEAALREARRRHNDPLRVRETLIEKILRDAIAEGHFDDLPYQGERLPLEDDAAAGEMASAFRILRNAGAAPHWIETDKEIRRLLDERDRILDHATRSSVLSRDRYRAQLRDLVTDHNRLLLVLNHEAPTPQQHRRPLDLATELEGLERRWPN
jgi:hypothetical protein